MAGALINITDAGRAALVAPGNAGTTAHKIVEIGLSTGLFDATDRTLKKLPNELKRIATFSGENVAFDTIHVTLRDDTPDQYKLYGLGLYLENGVLFGVYCQNAADGPIMEKSPAALLLLSADMQFATIDAARLVFGDASFTNPPATTERQGVVELATQAEVNAGADDARAITPKTAAARYAALTGAVFSGTVSAAANAGDTGAQLYVMAASGANGRESKVRFYGTFGNNADTNTRLVASIRAGFDGGIWGKEYLDFCLNNGTVNDAQKDSLQSRVLRLVSGSRALFNTTTDDGTNVVQIGGNASTRGVHTFGYGATVGWVTADSTIAYFRSNGHVSVGSESPAGFLDLVAGGASRARVLPSGRVLFGTSSDDGVNLLQVAGSVSSTGRYLQTSDYASLLLRAASSSNRNAWRLISNVSGNVDGSLTIQHSTDNFASNFTDSAVFTSTGRVILDKGATINTNLAINRDIGEGQILLGQNDGYLYGNAAQAGWYSGTKGSWNYNFATKNLYVNDSAVWHAGNLTPLDLKKDGTMSGDLYFSPSKRIILAEGSAVYPSLTFANDGAPDTGLYHVNDGTFAVTCNGVTTVRFTPGITAFDRPLTGPTPAAGDVSTLLATTEWVTAKIAATEIGQIVLEPRTSARAGYLKANGAVLNRADYPGLWAYAQASGALMTEAQWSGGNWGCFSSGDGASTFRIPELRGEGIRCWDDGRGVDGSRAIGSWQDSQNRSHAHGATATAVGDHTHSAWTDTQGWHDHAVADPGHIHADADVWTNQLGSDVGTSAISRNSRVGTNTTRSQTGIGIYANGNHAHNIGMNGAGAHGHTITVNADGGSETRVRTVALLAMIRAY